MLLPGRAPLLKLIVLCGALFLAVPSPAATPGFTLKATNVSVSGMGSGVSDFTIQSVGGFAGQVGVTCSGPSTNLLPDLVLPNCAFPVAFLTVPANGTVSGKMSFVPPAEVQTDSDAMSNRDKPDPRELPPTMAAGMFAAVGLLATGLRRRANRWLRLGLLAAFCFTGAASISGCVGKGGLSMTPGTYSYVITGGTLPGQSATISVTVH